MRFEALEARLAALVPPDNRTMREIFAYLAAIDDKINGQREMLAAVFDLVSRTGDSQ
jgi:hypothetical protein